MILSLLYATGGVGIYDFGMFSGHSMPPKNTLDVVSAILAKYGHVAMHGGAAHAHLLGVYLSGNVKFDVGTILSLIRSIR